MQSRHKQILQTYLSKLVQTIRAGDAREESFYPALKTLIENVAHELGRKNVETTIQPRPVEGSCPDFRVWDGASHVIGYIEAKFPDAHSLDAVEATEQLKRYRETFPNLILTDFLEFRLYRDGECIKSARLARPAVLVNVRRRPPLEDADGVWELLETYLDFSLPAPLSAQELAVALAKRTRFLRDVVREQLEFEKEKGALSGFYEAFRKFLIGELTEEAFADLYAQTVTYGLFAARTRATNGFSRRSAFEHIPPTVGILRDLFRFISLGELPEQMRWIVDDIAQVLAVADVRGMMERYFHEGRGSDPIVHFYETFLAHYDPEERERRLSVEEIRTYCRVVTALQRTLALQNDIDEAFAAVESGALVDNL